MRLSGAMDSDQGVSVLALPQQRECELEGCASVALRHDPGLRSEDPRQRAQLLAEIPLGRVGDPQDVAAVCAFLASDAAAYVTGSTYVVDGGLMRYTKGL